MWVEIFKTGTHTDGSGRTRTWTIKDLDKIVNDYEPDKREAPLVFGHPKNNDPAFGWVERLKRSGDVLMAKFKDIVPAVKQLIKSGQYKKRSISLYNDGTLRHVGLLGAVQPAVPGLKDIKFSNNENNTLYEFERREMPEEDITKQENQELKKMLLAAKAEKESIEKKLKEKELYFAEQEKKLKKQNIDNWFSTMVEKGKALPEWKDKGLLNFMEQLEENNKEIEFSEGTKQTALNYFKEFISSFSEHGLFKKMTDNPEEKEENEFSEDISDMAMHI